MYYEKRVFIPKNTTSSDPVIEVIPIHPGILRSVSVEFPAGCAGLVHVCLDYWERQLYPSNPDSSLSGDDVLISWGDDLEIVDPPHEIVVRAWNEDDTYQHGPIVRLQISPFADNPLSILANLFISHPITLSEAR